MIDFLFEGQKWTFLTNNTFLSYESSKKGPNFTSPGITNMRICCFYVFNIIVNCMSLGFIGCSYQKNSLVLNKKEGCIDGGALF